MRRRRHFPQLKFNVGKKPAETQGGSREDVRYGRNAEPDPQRSCPAFDGRPRFAQSILGILQQFCGFRKQTLACIRERNFPARAHKERTV